MRRVGWSVLLGFMLVCVPMVLMGQRHFTPDNRIITTQGGTTVGIDADGDGTAECTFGVAGTDDIGGTLSCLSNDDAGGSFSLLENIDNGTHSITVSSPESLNTNRAVVLQDDLTPFDTAVANMNWQFSFCGNGAAAGATVWLPPPTTLGLDLIPGGAGCDGRQSVVSADDTDEIPYDIRRPFTATGMICQVRGGVDDTVIITLMLNASASALTCTLNITAGPQGLCRSEEKVAIGGGQRWALEMDADDDDLSAADYLCTVFASF
jgi:hypothetical protein